MLSCVSSGTIWIQTWPLGSANGAPSVRLNCVASRTLALLHCNGTCVPSATSTPLPADEVDVEPACVVVRDRLDVGELDDDRGGGVLLAGGAVEMRGAIHDAVVHLVFGVIVVLQHVALATGVRDLDRGGWLRALLEVAELQRAEAGFDRAAALAQHIANRGRA